MGSYMLQIGLQSSTFDQRIYQRNATNMSGVPVFRPFSQCVEATIALGGSFYDRMDLDKSFRCM